jgi:hypothetical protein
VVHPVVTADGSRRYTSLALREDRGDQPRVFGSNAVAHNGFRNGLQALDVRMSGVERR